jgi:hypothetical protein
MGQMRNTYMGSVELENILELPNESESEAEDHLTNHSFDECETLLGIHKKRKRKRKSKRRGNFSPTFSEYDKDEEYFGEEETYPSSISMMIMVVLFLIGFICMR